MCLPAEMSTVDPPTAAAPRVTPAVAPLRRRMLSAGFWSFAGRGVAIGVFFLTDMILARALSKEEFAGMYLATGVATFIAAFASLGTHQILSRTVRQTLYGSHPERTEKVIQTCTRLLLLGVGLASAIFLIALPFFIDDGAQWQPFRDFPLGILAWGCLSSACLNSAFALQGLDDFRSATLVGSRRGGLLPNVAFAIFAAITWKLGVINATSLIYGQAVLQTVTLIYARKAIRRQLERFGRPSAGSAAAADDASAPGQSVAWYFHESLPYLVALLTQTALDELDGVVVGHFVHDSAVADYGAARRLVRLMSTPFVMYAVSMGPFVAELLAKGEKNRLERIMRASATLVSIPMVAVFAIYLLAPELTLQLAFGAKFAGAAATLQLLTIGQVFFVLLGNSGQTLLMAGRQKALMVCSIFALAAYCALAPILIARYGVAGAAVLQSLIMIGQAGAVTLLARRLVGIWTVATFSPTALRRAVQSLLGRNRRRPTTGESLRAEEVASDIALDE
jgi:O-antigen/teichoic acid export membrane protein